MRGAREPHARTREQHERAIDAGEAGERAIGNDVRDAHAPVELGERRAGGMRGDLRRVPAAVLPRHANVVGGLEDAMHGSGVRESQGL